jgi:hypothetical protein
MDSNRDKAMEADFRRAVRRAFRQLQKDLESEPALIIESGAGGTLSEETMAGIRAWLFRERVRK